MSTLSQFSGGGIKSIQRGTITFTNTGNNYVSPSTATISAVNTAKTMLNFCGCASGSSYSNSNGVAVVASVALTNSTTVTASFNTPIISYVYSSPGTPTSVSYEVIEYF